MKEFVKKIEELADFHEDKKEEKALRQLLIEYPMDIYCLSQLAGALLFRGNMMKHSVIFKRPRLLCRYSLLLYIIREKFYWVPIRPKNL